MNWKSLIFWKSKQEEVKPALYSNTDFARDLLTQIQHKSKSNQKEIVAMLFSQVFDDAHIHSNPKRRTPDIDPAGHKIKHGGHYGNHWTDCKDSNDC